MSMIYQVHPEHGKHIAYDPKEAQWNIQNGWKTVTEDEFNNFGTKPKAVVTTHDLPETKVIKTKPFKARKPTDEPAA